MKSFKLICLLICASFTHGTLLAQEASIEPPFIEGPIAKPAPIIANELKEIGLWGIGIENKGFVPVNSDLWANARGENLGILFDKVSANTKFVPINSLLQRVLFSGGTAPIASNEIGKKRLVAAARIGDAEKVSQLLSMVPQIHESQYLTAYYADSLFAIGKNDEACALLNDNRPDAPVKIILELRAVCYALNQEGAAAQLSLDLASQGQTKSTNDQWLARAIVALSQTTPTQAAPTSNLKYRADNGHFFAISNQLKLEPNDLSSANVSPINMLNLARQPIMAQEQIQKNAGKTGILSSAEYRQLKADNIAAAVPAIAVDINTDGDLNLVSFEGEDFVKELKSAGDIDEWWVIAKRIGPKLTEIQNPNPKNIEPLIDAALANEDIASARRFMAFGGQTPTYRNVILAIIDDKLAPIIIRDIIGGEFGTNYPKSKAIADLSILWAVGKTSIGQESLLDTNSAGGTALPQNIMLALEEAQERQSKAEIALNAGLALQSIDAKAVDLSQMARIIKALKAAGFDSEAKELSIYSILARRIDFNKSTNAPRNPPATRTSSSAPQNRTTSISPNTTTTSSNRPVSTPSKPKPTPARNTPNIPDWRGQVD